jgi:hypothetical protein
MTASNVWIFRRKKGVIKAGGEPAFITRAIINYSYRRSCL